MSIRRGPRGRNLHGEKRHRHRLPDTSQPRGGEPGAPDRAQLEHTNAWTPNASDKTPPGAEKLTAYRTVHGIVYARGMVAGMMICQGQFLAPFRQTLPIGLRAARTLMIDAAPGRVL